MARARAVRTGLSRASELGLHRPSAASPLHEHLGAQLSLVGRGAGATYRALASLSERNLHGAVWARRETVAVRRIEMGYGAVSAGTLTHHYTALARQGLIARFWRVWPGSQGSRRRLYVVFVLGWSNLVEGTVGASGAVCFLIAHGAPALRRELELRDHAGDPPPVIEVATGLRKQRVGLSELYPVPRALPLEPALRARCLAVLGVLGTGRERSRPSYESPFSSIHNPEGWRPHSAPDGADGSRWPGGGR